MKTTKEIFDELKKPFEPKDIEWRIGRKTKDGTRGTALAYINARAVQDRLDDTVGPDKWSVSYTPVDFGNVKGFLANLTIELPDGQVLTRSDGSNLTDFELFKGGISGSLKRAASAFGIGRYLYGLAETGVAREKDGKFTPPRLPAWALPEGNTYPETGDTPGQSFAAPQEPTNKPNNTPTQLPVEGGTDDVVFTAGKFRGMPVSSVTDYGYLDWVVNKSNMHETIKKAASVVLANRPSTTVESKTA